MKKNISYLVVLVVLSFVFTSCTDAVAVSAVESVETSDFWDGLWHGITFIFAFIGNVFGGEYLTYAPVNSGVGYDFGFLIGLGGMASGRGLI